MKLSDPIDDSIGGTGIIEMIDFLCGSDADSYPKVQKKRNINLWYRRVQQIIKSYMDKWLFEGDWALHAFTTTSRTTGITIANDILSIEAVYVNYDVSNNATWIRAKVIDPRRLPLPPMGDADIYGRLKPRYWLTDYVTMKIDPQPATEQANGVKIRITDRVADLSADADEPVFYEGCHPILAAGPALDYALSKNPEKIPEIKDYLAMLFNGEGGLKEVYATRIRDEEARIIPQSITLRRRL